ncbi:hypothetical protein BH23GEM9_BH23GEM9_28850 [soil metagenome]
MGEANRIANNPAYHNYCHDLGMAGHRQPYRAALSAIVADESSRVFREATFGELPAAKTDHPRRHIRYSPLPSALTGPRRRGDWGL